MSQGRPQGGEDGGTEGRTLVLTPYGRDAALAGAILREAGLAPEVCDDLEGLCRELRRGAALAVIAEEALVTADQRCLAAWLAAQPTWSDFPFVLLTRRLKGGLERNPLALRLMDVLGNVSFVERPFHALTLVSAAAAARRARLRQYQTRDHLREREGAAARQLLLLGELSHRVKNMLAVIEAIAKQTSQRAETAGVFVHDFRGRLRALGAAHDLLTAGGWERVSLAALARAALVPHTGPEGERLRLGLDEASLTPALAQSLALVFHELATNAAKHGALSVPGGRVRLAGRARGQELRLLWSEKGGPPVARPASRGFGTALLGQALAHQHSGRVELDWRRSGLVCRMSLPLG